MTNCCSVISAVLIVALLLCGSCAREESEDFEFRRENGLETVAVLRTTQGDIVVGFFPDKAPMHVENFLALCGSGFYDGTYFHRVARGFLIQGGDPSTRDDDTTNDGRGGHTFRGPGTTLAPEFNDIAHTRGIVSQARGSSPESGGSQFFILLSEARQYDRQFTGFGRVIEGLDVVQRISEQPGIPLQGKKGFNPLQHQYVETCRIEMRSPNGSK